MEPVVTARAVPRPPRSQQKTYSHLASQRRLPTEYEIATSRLLYHPERGFEVDVPIAGWYERYQRGAALVVPDWEAFADPRATTYARYVERMARREAFVDTIIERIEQSSYDAELPDVALDFFEAAIAPLRYPWHGLQMVAGYVGSMAPAGRIACAAAFQAADELRALQRVALRIAMLRDVRPGLGDDSRARWQTAPEWQPLREFIERLLVTWDWSESFCALNVCLKPLFDELVLVQLALRARQLGDHRLAEIFESLDEDARWHREWSGALVTTVLGQRSENRAVLDRFVAVWQPRAWNAVAALAPFWPDFATVAAGLTARHSAFLHSVGLVAEETP